MMHPFLKEAQERGFFYQCSDLDGLNSYLQGGGCGYLGFDGTARSLHVGNLVGIMFLRLLQRHGGHPIVLMGDATTRVGDPSGKDSMRKMLDAEAIEDNFKSIQSVFKNFLYFYGGEHPAMFVRNGDWLSPLKYLDFLATFGPLFSMNRMLTFESVKRRLEREQPLSFLEFNYMILQAYDFLHLHQTMGCCLQLGGSDQWGNIINGVELVRRVTGHTVYGLTAPLITLSSGQKMGKSEKGAIWLNADALSPYDYWQFWRNTNDQDVGRFLRLFTDLSLDEIVILESKEGAALNESKIVLADEATALCHGRSCLVDIHESVQILFKKSSSCAFSGELPLVDLHADFSRRLDDVFMSADLASSKSAFKRLIEGGGVRVNDNLVTDPFYTFTDEEVQKPIKVSVGKKKHKMVVFGGLSPCIL